MPKKYFYNEDYELELLREEDEKEEPTTEEPTEKDEDIDFDFANEDEPELSLSDLGKVYTLKQILKTLNILQNHIEYLSDSYEDISLIKLQDTIEHVKELTYLVIFNIDKYLDKLDSIITILKNIIKYIAKELEKYDDNNKQKQDTDNTFNTPDIK